MTMELHLMVGIPASGKSTFIKQETEKFEADGYTVAIISRDAIRKSILREGDNYFDKENAVFAEFVRQINESMAEGIDIVFVDATHINPASRNKILSRLKPDSRTQLIIDWMDTSYSLACKRNSQREGFAKVPETALEDMYNSFKIPSLEEFRKQSYYGFNIARIRVHEEINNDLVHV